MNPDQRPATTLDARRAERQTLETPVTLRLEADSIEGLSDNLSEAGIMFFTDQPVRCVVELAGPQGPRRYTGRIVRLQRMNETNTGLAVEFDAE